jgi:hypothetical protein
MYPPPMTQFLSMPGNPSWLHQNCARSGILQWIVLFSLKCLIPPLEYPRRISHLVGQQSAYSSIHIMFVRITYTFQSPRDAVTISRTFNDATTIIDVSTSLPRSPDEPAYLRPSPPYVRSNVKRERLFKIDRIIAFDTPVQYSHGVFSLYHPHHLSRRPPQTRLPENPALGVYVLLAFGNTTYVQCGTLAPRAAFLSNWPPWFLAS